MAYMVIARKWRPKTFDEVIGQLHVTKTLKNAIVNKRIAHAYLFAGTRGVGKTTTARIMAKALNCVNGPSPEPCNQCIECEEIAKGMAVDVIEIDGASNRGIDEVRDLRERAVYAPSRGRYKIYIIDEVHMLTKEAFNALLKILEEPPAHIIFMFATTEMNKVPITILSRCQCFNLKRIPIQDIEKQLTMICEKEGIKIGKEDLFLIAKSADGSMRDAQSLLDQIVSFSGKDVKSEDVATVLGVVDLDIFKAVMEGIQKKDPDRLLKTVQSLTLYGHDIGLFCRDLLEYVRSLMITKTSKEPYSLIEFPRERVDEVKELASTFSIEELHQIFDILSRTEIEIGQSSDPVLFFEMTLLKLTKIKSLKSVQEIIERLGRIESSLMNREALPDKAQPLEEPGQEAVDEAASPSITSGHKPEKTKGTEDLEDIWSRVIKQSEKKREWLPSILTLLSPISLKGDILELGFIEKNSFCIDKIKDSMPLIHETAQEALGREITLKINDTLIKKPDEKREKKKDLKEDTPQDETLKEALDIFGGKVVGEKKITKG